MTIHSINGGSVGPTPPPPKLCPLTLTARSSTLTGDSIAAAPCLGDACMASVPVTDEQGRPVGTGCALCLGPQTINNVAGQLGTLTGLVQLGLRAQGLIPMPHPIPKQNV
jgi:hypothetical protein